MAEFKNVHTGEVMGAEDGSMLARRLLRRPEWELQEAGTESVEGEPALSSLTREELEVKAAELEVDLEKIQGTGKDGTVVKADVLKAVEEATAAGTETPNG